jgi:hypothetical protein
MIVWKNALPMKEKINKMVLYPLSILGILFSSTLFLRAQERLGLFDKERITTHRDWLVQKTGTHARLYRDADGHLVFANGLIARTFSVEPDAATIGLDHLVTGQSFLRSVRPEAELVIDGRKFEVGGLTGQPIHNYLLPEWLNTMRAIPGAFHLEKYELFDATARFPWKKRLSWMPRDLPWPYTATALGFHYRLG